MYKKNTTKLSLMNRVIFSLGLLFAITTAAYPVTVSSLSPASPILAATSPQVDCVDNQSAANCGITRYILLFINVLSATLGVVVTIVVIIAGIQYSASAGDPQAIANAKKRISNALLALVLFAFMYGFLQWIVPGGIL